MKLNKGNICQIDFFQAKRKAGKRKKTQISNQKIKNVMDLKLIHAFFDT